MYDRSNFRKNHHAQSGVVQIPTAPEFVFCTWGSQPVHSHFVRREYRSTECIFILVCVCVCVCPCALTHAVVVSHVVNVAGWGQVSTTQQVSSLHSQKGRRYFSYHSGQIKKNAPDWFHWRGTKEYIQYLTGVRSYIKVFAIIVYRIRHM